MLRHAERVKDYFLAATSFAIGLLLLHQLQKRKNLTTEYFRQNKYIEQSPPPTKKYTASLTHI